MVIKRKEQDSSTLALAKQPIKMNLMRNYLIIAMTLLFSQFTWAKEELVIIQTISTSKKSFVIRKGKSEGVLVNQESLFTSEKFSLAARVVDVTREYSVWQLSDSRAVVPFQKGETVNYTNTIENLYTEIPMLRYDPKELAAQARERARSDSLRPEKWLVRGNLSYTLSESITDTAGDLESSRSGINVEAHRLWNFHPKMTVSFGLRYDRENSSISSPNLDIPTTRVLGVGDFVYHFDPLDEAGSHLYMGVGVGIGRSVTQVDDSTSTGLATLLPAARLGYQTQFNRWSMIVESVVESINATESFIDGPEQKTNMVNAKVAIGVMF